MNTKTIFLIGFMGSGKSHLGNALSKRLDYKFVDLDATIEKELDRPISDVFKKYGEEHFRRIESSILHRIGTANGNVIVSTGGGTPCFNKNLEYMNQHGVTIYLNTPVDELSDRLAVEKENRPLISHIDDKQELKSFISNLLKERMRFYSAADYKVSNVSAFSVERRLDSLEKLVKHHPNI